MKPKKDTKDTKQLKKQGKPFKDFIPNSQKQPRENIQPLAPESFEREYTNSTEPYEIPEEWPSEEELNKFDFGLNSETKFTDKFHFHLPNSLVEEGGNEIKWLRPEIYVKEKYLSDKIKKNYPNKNTNRLKTQIKSFYLKSKSSTCLSVIQENNNPNNLENHEISEKTEEELIEEARMHSFKPYFQVLSQKIEFKVMEWYERDETEEEMKKRHEEQELLEKIKNEQLKKEKKGPKTQQKKNEEHKEAPLKIRVARPSNIDMSGPRYSKFSKWLSSQFQIIKDLDILDCYNGKSVFQKIYPQVNGIPVYNPHGKYWIKLFFMGKYRKIEIDDQFPCSKNDYLLLPHCPSLEELWPVILAKAILKLFSFKFQSINPTLYHEVGDTAILHCLTGFIGEKIDDKNNLFDIFHNFLSDEIFINKQKILMSFTQNYENLNFQRAVQSERVVSKSHRFNNEDLNINALLKLKDMNQKYFGSPTFEKSKNMELISARNFELGDNSLGLRPAAKRNTMQFYSRMTNDLSTISSRSNFDRNKNGSPIKLGSPRKKNSNIKKGVSAKSVISVDDPNDEVVMNESYKGVFIDFAYSLVESFFNENFNMKRIKPIDFSDLKMELNSRKKNFKHLLKEERKPYLQEINEIKVRHREEKNRRLEELKLPGSKVHYLKIKNDCENHLNLSFILSYSEEEIEMVKKCLFNKWDYPPPYYFEDNQDMNTHTLNKSEYHNESRLSPNKSFDAEQKFNMNYYMKLIGNPEIYSIEKLPQERPHGAWVSFTDFCGVFQEFLIFHNPNKYRFSKKIDNLYNYSQKDAFETNLNFNVIVLTPSHIQITNNNKYDKSKSCLLIVFEPNLDKFLSLVDVNLYLIVDIFSKEGDIIEENLLLSSFFYTIQLDNLEMDKEYYMIIKSQLCPYGYHLSIFSDHSIENMSHNDYLKKFHNFHTFLFKIDHSPLEKNSFNIIARIALKVNKRVKFNLNVTYNDNYLKNQLKITIISQRSELLMVFNEFITLDESDSCYFIIAEIFPNYNVNEGTFNFEFLADHNDINFELIQHINTFEVKDNYIPNKHGIIFKELIYLPEIVYSSLWIKIRREKINKVISTDPKKKGELVNMTEYSDIEEKIRMKLQLFKKGELIFEIENYNSFFLKNQIFEGNSIIPIDPKSKNQNLGNSIQTNTPYLLVCTLDLTEIPNWLIKPDYSNDIGWVIRVISSENIGFVQDTSKEDSERALKDSWETAEAGRSEKAKISRKKYQLEQKKINGLSLTEEENKILNSQRERKITVTQISQVEEKKESKIKNVKKEEKKKVETVQVLPIQTINYNKKMPNITDHVTTFIKDFLDYCNRNRTKKLSTNEKVSIMNNDIQNDIYQNILNNIENQEKQRNQEILAFNLRKQDMIDSVRKLSYDQIQMRKMLKNEKDELIVLRENLKMEQNYRREIEKKLLDITNEIYDLNSAITIYKEILASGFKTKLIDKAFWFINTKKEEQYRNDVKKLTTKDKQIAIKICDEIRLLELKIDEEILKKVFEIAGVN